MVTLIIVGVLAWALKEAAEDVIRTVRGDPPPSPRKGFRGYVEDRWNALADRHHRAEESGMISQLDSWAYRRHLARKKALKRAGFATDEAIALAAAEHRRRMALIEQGIDPDTMLRPVHPKGDGRGQPPAVLTDEPLADDEPEAETEQDPVNDGPGVSIDGHFYDNVQVWLNPEYFPPETEITQPGTDDQPEPDPQVQPWSPFTSTSTTDTKENTMANNGEITGPAAVLQFHNDLKTSLDQAAGIVDILNGLAYELEGRANDAAANIAATETAAAGMDGLGMSDAAAAARSLMETQQAIQDALTEAAAIKDRAAVIADQIGASQIHLAAIKAAHDAQLAVQDARAGAGRGNLAKDSYLDDND